MNKNESAKVLRRLKILWPRELPEGTDTEWVRVLAPLEYRYADSALDEMRDTLMFPPSVADFRSAYYLVLSLPCDTLALPPGDDDEAFEPLRDRYGENQKDWVYCWRCDMALSLEERGGKCGYDFSRGLYHYACPKKGSVPAIPSAERVARNEYFDKRRIAFGPYTDPVPYTT